MMKKIIIAALTMLTLWTTQAEYKLQIPLEASRGGSLPNGSIIYSGKNNEVSNKQCELYNAIDGVAGASYYWREYRGNILNEIKWNGTLLYKNPSTENTNSIDFEGFRYSKLNNGEPEHNLVWGVCREPI